MALLQQLSVGNSVQRERQMTCKLIKHIITDHLTLTKQQISIDHAKTNEMESLLYRFLQDHKMKKIPMLGIYKDLMENGRGVINYLVKVKYNIRNQTFELANGDEFQELEKKSISLGWDNTCNFPESILKELGAS